MIEEIQEEINQLVPLLEASGKTEMASKYRAILDKINNSESLNTIKDSLLHQDIIGSHCSYNYIEDRLIGNITQLAQRL